MLPGGGKEDGETESQCVQCEVREETHLEVAVERLLLDEPNKSGDAYQRFNTYLCRPLSSKARPGCKPEPEAASVYAITGVEWTNLYDESTWDASVLDSPILSGLLRRIRAALQPGSGSDHLATLILASVVTDLIVSVLSLAGVGLPAILNPHSTPGTLLLCLTLSLIVLAATRSGRRGAFVASVVLLHTLADHVTSSLPTWPGGPRVGLFLYRHPIVDLAIESAVIFAGWWLYRRGLSATTRDSWATWAMLVMLIVCQAVFSALLMNS